MPEPLHLADPEDDGEIVFSRFVSLLGVEPGPAATFRPEPLESLEDSWARWIEDWFVPHLAPAFVETFHCGSAARAGEIQAIDSLLDGALSESMRSASLEAARAFLQGKEEMRGNREWIRFAERVESGETPGHLPVVFALQSALYHLPLTPALSSYAWFEFRSRDGDGIPPAPKPEETETFATILPQVAVAVSRNFADRSGDPGTLRFP